MKMVTDHSASSEGSIRIPDHELLRLIGRGSYGEVWLARNIMGTYRAVKIIRRDAFDSDSPFEREFAGIKKFEPISRTHGGFVDILQIGRNSEARCLYYVMEAADDLDLGQAIEPDRYIPRTLGKALGRVKRFSVEQCVQMGLALCQALEHLHQNGLVHRDIKPSNIVFVNGVPKLADIGLVTESDNAHSFVGTEGFIPPEGPGSKQADIYSLGKALYEIASSRDRLDFPALPAALSEFPDGEQFLELNECLIRACRLDPQQRYSSAREMYEDLALLASGKSLRRLRILERRWNSAKRAAAITIALIVVGAMIVFPLLRERKHADEIRERQIGVRSANGINELDQGDLAGAFGEFSEIFQLEAANKRHFDANQTRVASILADTPKITQMLFPDGRIGSSFFCRDGNRILTVNKGRETQLIQVTDGAVLASLKSNGAAYASLSPDDNSAVIADQNGWVSVWNLKTGEEVRLPHPALVMCARFSPSGNLIATACKDGKLRIWDATSHELVLEKTAHTDTIRCLAFSPDGRFLATGSADFTARIWTVPGGEPVGVPMRHPNWIGDISFSPDSTTILTAGHDGWVRLWKTATGDELPTVMKHEDLVTRAVYSPDGSMILTASNDSTVRLWNSRNTMPLARNHILKHSSGVFSADFSADGHQILTGCADGTIRVWDIADSGLEPELVNGTVNSSGTMVAVLTPGNIFVSEFSRPGKTNRVPIGGEVRELALSANGQVLAAFVLTSGKPRGVIQAWRPEGGELKAEIPEVKERVVGLTLSPDGAFLCVRCLTNRTLSVRVFDVVSGTEWLLPEQLRNSGIIAFHPNKKRLAIGTGGTVAVFEELQTEPVYPEISVVGNVRHIAFSDDGRKLLICQNDESISPKSAVLVDADTGKPTGREFWHRDGVLNGAFQPRGQRLITGGEDREGIIWDVQSARELMAPLRHRHQVQAVAFSPDAHWIGTASADAIVRVWDSDTGFPITPPLTCEKSQSQIIFLPDHSRFATIQNSTRAWLWTLPTTDMSPTDAIALSHLLNADLRVVGQPDTKNIAETWNRLKQKFPERFSSDRRQVVQWHARQYRIAESQKEEAATSFHLDRIRALDPENPLLNSPQEKSTSALAKTSR